jgi:hypothetical protein
MTSPVTWPTVGHQLGPGQPLRQYAIGVFCDRPDITAEAVNYYKTGRGNGTHDHSVYYLHPGYLNGRRATATRATPPWASRLRACWASSGCTCR